MQYCYNVEYLEIDSIHDLQVSEYFTVTIGIEMIWQYVVCYTGKFFMMPTI